MTEGTRNQPHARDAEHIVLCETLNDLRQALMHDDGRNLARPLLRSFLAYARGHFGPATYPERSRNLEMLMARFEKGEVALDLQLLHAFDDWFVHPIQKADRSSRPWLLKN